MTKDHRKYRLPHGREAKNRAAARPRRRLVVAGLLAGATVIGLAIAGTFRGGAPTRPQQRQAPGEPAGGVPAQPPAERQAPIPSAQAPVPESYDELKQEALAVGARLLERYPDALEPIGLLANVHFEVGNLAEATRCWKQCLKRHPDFAEAYYRLGLYARKEGNDKEAVNYLQTAFKLDPTLPDVQAHLGRCLMKLDRVDHALAVLEIEIGASRGGSVRYFFLGHAYLRTQQYDKAKGAFRAAVEITPSFTGAHYGLGTACTKLGQAEEAKKHFEDFRKLKARDAEAVRDKVKQDDVVRMRRIVAAWYYQAGKVYAGEDDLRQAEAHWLRAAAVNSADTKCRQALADLYQRQGKTRQAAELAAEVRSIVARQGN